MTVHDMMAATARVRESLLAPVKTPARPGRGERNTCELSVALLAADCVRRLAEAGIETEQSSDFELALETVGELDKPYLTDFLSPRKNDFFESNCFWLILRDGNGRPAGMIGARIDETGAEPLSRYSVRKLRNIFPDEEAVPVRPDRLPRIAEQIKGRVVYIGDLFFGQRLRTTNRQLLRIFLRLHYCTISLKWREFDWLYAFLRTEMSPAARPGSIIFRGFTRSRIAGPCVPQSRPANTGWPRWTGLNSPTCSPPISLRLSGFE